MLLWTLFRIYVMNVFIGMDGVVLNSHTSKVVRASIPKLNDHDRVVVVGL